MGVQFPPFAPEANRVTEVTRRNIVDRFLLGPWNLSGRMGAIEFFERVWDLPKMRSKDRREPNMKADLQRHYVNWGDYNDAEVLFDLLGVATCPDEQFGRFLALCLHPLVRPDSDQVAELLAMFNEHLTADGFMLVETSRISGHPVYEMNTIGAATAARVQGYDVALSFAGEQRTYVDAVAEALESAGVRVFYDRFEEANLWGEDLTETFDNVFLHGARFIVMFTSKEYADKMWPTYERRAAVESAMAKRDAYILPVRFDDTSIPGVRGTIGYQDARTKSPDEIARLILKKLGRAG